MPKVGRYILEDPIGEGAMAKVYRAHDPQIDRAIAIKFLRKEFHQDKEVVSRFLREAKAAGSLSHSGIVTIFDVGEADGVPYIAMELLKGAPLSDLLAEHGKMPVDKVISYGRQLAEALSYAHARGVVHRDIKPSNIWVCEDGAVKLLDFGIARRSEADKLRAELEALKTYAGQVLGTPRYMSPEQTLGRAVDHRTDFFSLGALLYEMLSGQHAFEGDGIAAIAVKITQEHPRPLSDWVDGCPKGLSHIIMRLMEKSPDRRYESGAEIAAALRREKHARDAATPSAGPVLSRKLILLLQYMLVIASVITLSFIAIHDQQTSMLRRMSSTTGAFITAFVAKNAALSVAENASLETAAQDWLPLQEFIISAADDPAILELRVVDSDGVVRASSHADEHGLEWAEAAGLPYAGEPREISGAGDRTQARASFERAITYAGANFGTVQLLLDTTDLKLAAARSAQILFVLGFAIFATMIALTALLSHLLLQPLRTLREALNDMVNHKFNYRISHQRRDEFGALFDRVNELGGRLQDAEAADEHDGSADGKEQDPDATMVQSRPKIRIKAQA